MRLTKISQKNSWATKGAIEQGLGIYPSELRQAITYDNRTENA